MLVKTTKERKAYKWEEAFAASKDYFAGDELPANIWANKYALRDPQGNLREKTPADMHDRLAGEFARIDAEKYKLNFDERYELYRDAVDQFARIVPQGSPMAAVGNPYSIMSASNCIVIESPEDSIGGIMKSGLELAQLMKRRAGVGLDISTLRPEGFAVNNAAKTTSGAFSFADFYSYVTRMIAQSGRRGALMVTLNVHHPDVEKFATMKADLKKVTGANVSIRLSDEFLIAVEKDAEYEQRWPCEEGTTPLFRRKVSAKQIWNTIIEMATKTAEPGLIFWDKMVSRLPAHSYPQFKSRSTNPCCFSTDENVFVVTDSGIKEIKQVTDRDLIWADETKTWEKTSGFFLAGTHPVYRVRFSNQEEVFITNNHKLEKMTKKRNDNVSKELIELAGLKIGDKISHHVNKSGKFGKKGTYEEGQVLGWLTGDGFISYKDVDSKFPTMGLAFWESEHDVAGKLQKAIEALGLKLNIVSNTVKNNKVKRIISEKLTEHFTYKFSLNPWCFKTGFNQFLFDASEPFLKGYLSSYFSADGTIQILPDQSRYSIQLASIDKDRLLQVKNLLLLFGIKSGVGLLRKAGEAFFDGKGYKTKDCYRLSITGMSNLKSFYDHIGFIADKKQEWLKLFVGNIYPNMKIEKQKDYVTIEEIELIGEKEVGCIEVENVHKFTANGIISGNSEIALSAFDSCRLISMNLTGYVKNAFKSNSGFNWDSFKHDIHTAMHMIDGLVDIELELIKKIQAVSDTPEEKELWQKLYNAGEQGRRTGLGTHGLADMFAQLNIKYDSQDALDFADGLYTVLRDHAYTASIDLAEVRGPFPAFDWEIEKNNEFIKSLPEPIRARMAKSGRRHISILTQAPTGSVSLLSKCGEFDRFNLSSGVEPVFRNNFTRRKRINVNDGGARVDFTDDMGDKWQHFDVYHGNVLNYMEQVTGTSFKNIDDEAVQKKLSEAYKKLPNFFVTSDQIDWKFRVKLQGIEQEKLDHSISSTINLPRGTTPDVVGGIYLEAWKQNLKGITVYVDGSRDGVLITDEEKKKTKAAAAEAVNVRPDQVVRMNAPERPKQLLTEIHHHTVNGKQWVAMVGLLNGEPYEMFAGYSELISLPKKCKSGKVIRRSGGKYSLHVDMGDEELVVNDIISTFNDPELAWTTRLISTSLRHGVPVEHLVTQLQKGESKLNSFNRVLARVLKKYIPDGEKVKGAVSCPQCNSTELKWQEGCMTCTNCGNSKCN